MRTSKMGLEGFFFSSFSFFTPSEYKTLTFECVCISGSSQRASGRVFQINTRDDWSQRDLWNRPKATKVCFRKRLSKYPIMSCLSSLNDDNIVTPIRQWPQM